MRIIEIKESKIAYLVQQRNKNTIKPHCLMILFFYFKINNNKLSLVHGIVD